MMILDKLKLSNFEFGTLIREMYIMSWFPIFKSQVEDEDFQKLTPIEKLYYWYLASEFNYYCSEKGSLFRTDLAVASALWVSEVKIRQARRKFQKLGWIRFRRGYQKGNGEKKNNVPTEYLDVRWSLPSKEHSQFVRMCRHTFEMMLSKLFEGQINHVDVVTHVYLFYWNFLQRYNCEDSKGKSFYIPKRTLLRLTGIADCVTHIKRLHELVTFSKGEHLFEYCDEYHEVKFTEWTYFATPEEDETAKKMAKAWEDKVEINALCMRNGLKLFMVDSWDEMISTYADAFEIRLDSIPKELEGRMQMEK